MPPAFIDFQDITKTFAGVTALSGVSLSIARGECHGLMGENGAGKSTLGKILAGIHSPDAGSILIDGRHLKLRSPRDAARAGISMVHQELAFCPDLSIAENLLMGNYPRRGGRMSPFIDHRAMRGDAARLLDRVGLRVDVRRPMRSLSTAQEQLVQIAAAIGTGANILIFDEPTSSLSEPEARRLFTLIEELRARGVTIIYVSHRMPEVFRLCDRISVLRDGRCIGTLDRASAQGSQTEMTQDRVVRMMIGRSLDEYFPAHLNQPAGRPLLSVSRLSSPGKFENVSFTLHAGEIVGFAGLVGSGRSEIAQAIFGLDRAATGSIDVDGHPMNPGRVHRAMSLGIGLVPEDRKRQGLILSATGRENFSLSMLDRFTRRGFLNQASERRQTREFFDRLRVRTPSIDASVAGLSGGNQQKVVLAKWIARGCRILIVDEPTRGVDIGAKAAIHALLDDLARQGAAIMLISSEMPELLNLSTRILVIRAGRLVGQMTRQEATQETLLRLMAGLETPLPPSPPVRGRGPG